MWCEAQADAKVLTHPQGAQGVCHGTHLVFSETLVNKDTALKIQPILPSVLQGFGRVEPEDAMVQTRDGREGSYINGS